MARSKVKRIERGWGGHFCASNSCLFKRNTLLEYGKQRIVVSTAGNMRYERNLDVSKAKEIGCNRFYETMAFHGCDENGYVEADVGREVSFDSKWAIDHIEQMTDLEANDMHEAVVDEIAARMIKGDYK